MRDKITLITNLEAYIANRSNESSLFEDLAKYNSTAKKAAALALIDQLKKDPVNFNEISAYNREVLAEGRLGKLYDAALMSEIEANKVEEEKNRRKIEHLETKIAAEEEKGVINSAVLIKLKEDIESTTQRNEDISSRLESMNSELKALRSENETLRKDVSHLETNIARLEASLSAAQSGLAASQSEVASILGELSQAKGDLAEAQAVTQNLQTALAQAQHYYEQEKQRLAVEYKGQETVLTAQLANAKKDYETKVSGLQGKLESAEAKNRELTAEVEGLNRKLKVGESQIKELEGLLSAALASNKVLQKKAKKAEGDHTIAMSAAMGQLSAQLSELTRAQEEVSRQKGLVDSARKESEKLRSNVNELKQQNTHLSNEILSLKASVARLEASLSEAQSGLAASQREVASILGELRQAQGNLDKAQADTKDLQTALTQAKTDYEQEKLRLAVDYKGKESELTAQLANAKTDYETKVSGLQGKLDAAEERNKDLTTEVEGLYQQLKVGESQINELTKTVTQLQLLIDKKTLSQSNSIISQLEDFITKTKKQKWDENSPELKNITKEALKSKIEGYTEKLDKLREKDDEIIDSQKEKYGKLITESEAFIARLIQTLLEKSSRPSPEPTPTPSPGSTLKSDRWKRFYAEHKPEGTPAAPAVPSTHKVTWHDLAHPTDVKRTIKVLAAMNTDACELDSDDKIAKFTAEAGARVICPTSGHEYSLSFKDKIPKAILEEKNAKKDTTESEDEYLQRKAATIINMIDNVLAKSEEINISTPDPFIAQIAEAYIDYLQTKCDLKIEVKPIVVAATSTKHDDKKAKDVFETLKRHMEPENIKKTQWYKDALDHRTEAATTRMHSW